MSDMIYRCISGAAAGNDGVCSEHGESACVIGVRVPSRVDTAEVTRTGGQPVRADADMESAAGSPSPARTSR